jgi:DNA-binding MarR family transcriptional regulator
VVDGGGQDLCEYGAVVDGEGEAHAGCGCEHVGGVSGQHGPARPVMVGDAGGHRERADVDDLDRQAGDSGGGPDQGGAPFLVEPVDPLGELGVPLQAVDPSVSGVGGDEYACGRVADAVHHAGRITGVVAERRAEQNADPVAEGAGARGGDSGRLPYRAVRSVSTYDVPGADGNGRARRAGMAPQSMGELVDDLAAKGYLERRDDPADRRAKRIFLTGKGHATAEASKVATRQIEEEISQLLGARQYAQMRRNLAAIAELHLP